MADDENEQLKLESKPSGSKNPLLTVLLLLNTIIMGAVGYFQYQSHQKVAQAETIPTVENTTHSDFDSRDRWTPGFTHDLGVMTANLAPGDGPRRFLTIAMVLDFETRSGVTEQEKSAQAQRMQAEVEARNPQLKDTVIRVLNTKRAEDLLTAEGKNYLKQEFLGAINPLMSQDTKIRDIYYTQFRVQ
jgi:flagellar protein FliL